MAKIKTGYIRGTLAELAKREKRNYSEVYMKVVYSQDKEWVKKAREIEEYLKQEAELDE